MQGMLTAECSCCSAQVLPQHIDLFGRWLDTCRTGACAMLCMVGCAGCSHGVAARPVTGNTHSLSPVRQFSQDLQSKGCLWPLRRLCVVFCGLGMLHQVVLPASKWAGAMYSSWDPDPAALGATCTPRKLLEGGFVALQG